MTFRTSCASVLLTDILTVVIPKDQYTFEVGSVATLECRVTGTPSATSVYWTKSHAGGASETIDMTNTSKYSGSSVTSPSLVISNAQSSDDGSYRCWATNDVGTAQSSPTVLTISGCEYHQHISPTLYYIDYVKITHLIFY